MKPLKKLMVERSAGDMANDVADPPAPAEEGKEDKNIFRVEIVEGKREKKTYTMEQKMLDWVTAHIEERDVTRVKQSHLYQHYLDHCISIARPAVTMFNFIRTLKSMFPKGFGVKADSPYHSLVKESKIRKKPPKVQAESLKLKMKDIIIQSLQELGNPSKGIRFFTLKQHIAVKYPALRIDVRTGLLKNALSRGCMFGHYECVKGIGGCGFYRVPGGDEKDEVKKEDAEEGEQNGDAEEGSSDDKENQDEDGAEKDTDDGEKEDKEDGADKEGKRGLRKRNRASASGGSPKKKKKKSSKKGNTERKNYRNYIIHSDPQRIEDSFPLAMCFNSEPKEATFNKIRKYISKHYPDFNVESLLKKTLENGLEKGYWELTRGTIPSGVYRLEITEFDPKDDNDSYGKVINAVTACTEPKQSSAILLKRYIQQYHEEFKLDERPHLFTKALERALKKNLIRRISGIGAGGSFQLVETFEPSPAILSGEDTESDYEYDAEEEEEVTKKLDKQDKVDVSLFQDAYVPRPTKRHGKGRGDTRTQRWGFQEDKRAPEKTRKPPAKRNPPPKKQKKEVKEEKPKSKPSEAKKAKKEKAKPKKEKSKSKKGKGKSKKK